MSRTLATLTAALLAAGPALGDTIVQNGSLSGGLGMQTQGFTVDRFDTMDGARRLNFVQLDFLTAVIGGGTTNGSGVPSQISAELSVDYFLGAVPLGQTAAVISTTIQNSGPPTSYSVFDNDSDQSFVNPPLDTAAWVGTGVVHLTAESNFEFSETPRGATSFSAGGSVQYTVTYDYDEVALPGDVTLDGVVDVDDLVEIITQWGPCDPAPPCAADVDGDGEVTVNDLVIVIVNWS